MALLLTVCAYGGAALLFLALFSRRAAQCASYAVVGCGVSIAAAVGQVVDDPRLTYPIVSWTMYGRTPPPHVPRLYWIVDGTRVLFPLSSSPLHEPRRILWRVRSLAARCRCSEGDRLADRYIEWIAEPARRALSTDRALTAIELHSVPVATTKADSTTMRYRWSAEQQGSRE